MESLPVPDEGMSHAIMRPLHCLRPGFDLPTVPVFVNCYHGPRPTRGAATSSAARSAS